MTFNWDLKQTVLSVPFLRAGMSFLTHNRPGNSRGGQKSARGNSGGRGGGGRGGGGRGGGGGGRGGASNDNNNRAIIVRVFPKERGSPTPANVQFLLQKKNKEEGRYGFVSSATHAKSRTAAKHSLREAFNKQCGMVQAGISNHPETPPLIHADSFEIGQSFFWVFFLPTTFNGWSPNPDTPRDQSINYANEPVVIGNSTYQTVKGHVWVSAADLFPAASVLNGPIASTECNLLQSKGADIATIVQTKLKAYYRRILQKASMGNDSNPTVLFQETHFQVRCLVDYANSKVHLSLMNMSTSHALVVILKPIQCTNHVLNVIATSFPPDSAQKIQRDGTNKLDITFVVGNFFGYPDLPIIELEYQTENSFHRIHLRLPIYLFRLSPPMPQQAITDSTQLQSELMTIWNTLEHTFNMEVPMGVLDQSAKGAWFNELKKCGLPLCTVMGNIVPLLCSLVGRFCLFLLELKAGDSGTTNLSIQCKYSEQNLFLSLLEVIYGLSSETAGMEMSLLDCPAIP